MLQQAPQTEAERYESRLRFRVALNWFNKKPERGMQLLMQFGFVAPTPQAVARFLLSRSGLAKAMIAEYLGTAYTVRAISVFFFHV